MLVTRTREGEDKQCWSAKLFLVWLVVTGSSVAALNYRGSHRQRKYVGKKIRIQATLQSGPAGW